MKTVLEISARKHIPIKEARKEFHSQKNISYAKTLQKQNPTQNTKKQEYQFDATPFVPDRLQSLEFAIVEQNKNHKAEISSIKKTNKAEIAEINARITEQEIRHLAEINQRDELIMEKDQMIIHQEQQIAELNRLITKLEAEKKSALAVAAKLESDKKEVETKVAAPSLSAAVSPSSVMSSSATTVAENTLKETAAASLKSDSSVPIISTSVHSSVSKVMTRPSSVKRTMSHSPENGKNSQPPKRDRKDSSREKTLSVSDKQAETPKSANFSPRNCSPSPVRTSPRSSSRSRSLERWKGERKRSNHIPSHVPCTKGPAPPNQNQDGAK